MPHGDVVDAPADLLDLLVGQVGSEERAGEDPDRDLLGLCHDIDALAVAPGAGHHGNLIGHRPCVMREFGGVERGLEMSALLAVAAVRAGGEAVAQELTRPLVGGSALVEQAVVEEGLADQDGVAEDQDGDRSEPDFDDVSVRCQGAQEGEGVADDGVGVACEGQGAGCQGDHAPSSSR